MNANEIRQKFIDFFTKNEHKYVPSSSLIPHGDPTLMFVNAGMVQFKNYFLGLETPPSSNIVSVQKCVRAGGKHNDLSNVGYTARHHTFFEMLGNFSFGGYFKKEAIRLAWIFLTEELGIPKERLYITVYHTDEEAFNIWQEVSSFDESRIIKIDTSDNFWSAGEFGLCGPCSEIFYDHGEEYDGGLPGSHNQDGDRYVEIWNMVFMEFDRKDDGTMAELPVKAVDTGMGLERISAVIQGVSDNFETDLFSGLINISKKSSQGGDASSADMFASHKIMADHIRATVFLISDGVLPSNEGRGYVLRRIMRRAIRHGYKLGYNDSGIRDMICDVISKMRGHYIELIRVQSLAIEIFASEEEKFKKILKRGMELLQNEIRLTQGAVSLSGDFIFSLYDSYGFPIDIIEDILREQGMNFDSDSFNILMEKQKERSKKSWSGSGEELAKSITAEIRSRYPATDISSVYRDYSAEIAEDSEDSADEFESTVLGIVHNDTFADRVNSGEECLLIFDKTSFYGESGGQVGDTGSIISNGGGEHLVVDTKKYDNVIAHKVIPHSEISLGDKVVMKIDRERRKMISVNHTATHMLHKALKNLLGEQVSQKGSLVNEKKLRFDFMHDGALSREQISILEANINEGIQRCEDTKRYDMKYSETIERGIDSLFGEKYGDIVTVVEVGHSIELCGGTHIKNSGNIGLFRIISEEAVSSGVRRIEAITGQAALEYSQMEANTLYDLTRIMNCSKGDLVHNAEKMICDKRSLTKDLLKIKSRNLIFEAKSFIIEHKGVTFDARCIFNEGDEEIKLMIKGLQDKGKAIFVVNLIDGTANVTISVSPDICKKISARSAAEVIKANYGGVGGGSDKFARLGRAEISLGSIDSMLSKISEII